jgi:hypothetical protein
MEAGKEIYSRLVLIATGRNAALIYGKKHHD